MTTDSRKLDSALLEATPLPLGRTWLRIPLGWATLPADYPMLLLAVDPAAETFVANLSAVRGDPVDEADLPSQIRLLDANLREFHLIDASELSVAGVMGTRLLLCYSSQGMNLVCDQVVRPDAEGVTALSLTCGISDYARYERIFSAVRENWSASISSLEGSAISGA